MSTISIKYKIRFYKDEREVKVTYDLRVPVGSAALIADFQLIVDGTELIEQFRPGQVQFNGDRYHTLATPDQDATVSFRMSSNQGWTASDSSYLRGNKKYDDVPFSN